MSKSLQIDPNQKENAKDVLLAFLKEHHVLRQHYETQRSTVSNLLVIVAAAILAFVAFDPRGDKLVKNCNVGKTLQNPDYV